MYAVRYELCTDFASKHHFFFLSPEFEFDFVLQNHCFQPLPDCCGVPRLPNCPLPAHWRKGQAHGGLLLPQEGRLDYSLEDDVCTELVFHFRVCSLQILRYVKC